MSTFNTLGPAEIYVTYFNGTNVSLGWAERSPDINYQVTSQPTANATSGVRLGGHYCYQGTEALIECVFTRFDLNNMKNYIRPFISSTLHNNARVDWLPVGAVFTPEVSNLPAVMNFGSSAVRFDARTLLTITYPYVGRSITFLSAIPEGIRVIDIASVPVKVAIRWHAVRIIGNLQLGFPSHWGLYQATTGTTGQDVL
jgi:hypothetical protein